MRNKLDSTTIEELGIDVLNPFFGYSATLAPLFRKRDKYPIWDGDIMLYKEGGKNNNKYLIGPIHAQVKSTSNKNIPEKKAIRSLKEEEIDSFLNNGGVAYFFVYVHPTIYEKSKAFYSLLTPVDLYRYKSDMGSNHSISIEMSALPRQMDEQIELDFKDFYEHCHRQYNYSGPIYLKDIQKNNVESFNVVFSTKTNNFVEFIKQLTSRENFVYVTFKGDPTKTPHPLGDRRYKLKAAQEVDLNISVSGNIFYEKCIAEIENGELYITVKDVMRFPFPIEITGDPFSGRINLNTKYRTLNQQIHSIEFLIEVIRTKHFYVGETRFNVDGIGSNDLTILQRDLDNAYRLKNVLDRLHVTEDLDISNLTKEDLKNINILIDHFDFGKDVSISGLQPPGFAKMNIANISIVFFVEKKNENSVKLNSVYDLSSYVFYTDTENGQKIVVPSFVGFCKEYYRDASNINYSSFLRDLKSTMNNDKTFFECANWTILRMLCAYDEQIKKNDILLKTALEMSEWLESVDTDEESNKIHTINRLQTIKRMRCLNAEEEKLLMGYIDSKDSSNDLKFASYILLDGKSMAKRLFGNFNDETKEFYVNNLPIYNLIKDEL